MERCTTGCLHPMSSPSFLWHHLAVRVGLLCSPGLGGCSPGSWLFQLKSELQAFRCLSLASPLCDALAHLSPARGQPVLISLAVTCSSACLFSLVCHHALSHAAPFRDLLCAERSIFCIFSLFRSALKTFLASVELGSPLRGSARISAAGSGMVSSCP